MIITIISYTRVGKKTREKGIKISSKGRPKFFDKDGVEVFDKEIYQYTELIEELTINLTTLLKNKNR